MNVEQRTLARMVPPGQRRSIGRQFNGGVIQIWVTRACDKSCYGCTQGSNLKGHTPAITLDQFRTACLSLQDYFGVVGVFGGNPCLHPQFPELCKILAETIPFERRGLWCNKLLGHGAIARQTFNPAVSNLNVHLDQDAYNEIRLEWPEAHPFGLTQDSRHSPPYVAMKDLLADEVERWELIANCDINQRWSAMVGAFRGELRAWFCEIAGAQSILHQNEPDYPDTGLQVEPGWWTRGMESFQHQVRYHCHACGVPLRGYGELSQAENGTEQFSQTHEAIYKPKKVRQLELVSELVQLNPGILSTSTDYLLNAKR